MTNCGRWMSQRVTSAISGSAGLIREATCSSKRTLSTAPGGAERLVDSVGGAGKLLELREAVETLVGELHGRDGFAPEEVAEPVDDRVGVCRQCCRPLLELLPVFVRRGRLFLDDGAEAEDAL